MFEKDFLQGLRSKLGKIIAVAISDIKNIRFSENIHYLAAVPHQPFSDLFQYYVSKKCSYFPLSSHDLNQGSCEEK